MSPNIFFNSWSSIVRIGVIGLLAYIGLVLLLRLSGKRTLSKMNAFDLVVTVALGSTLATTLLSKDVSLAEGMTAFVLLILLQFVVAWSATHSKLVSQLVKSEPTLLLHKGKFLESALKSERVTRDEVRAAVRQQGESAIEEVDAVILETDGSFSVISSTSENAPSALEHVQGFTL